MSEELKLELSHKEVEVLQTILALKSERGYSPSMRELGDALEMTQSGALWYVKKLRDRGALETHPGKQRALVLTHNGKLAMEEALGCEPTAS